MTASRPVERTHLPRLHAVTDDAVLSESGWTERAAAVLSAGGPDLALHLRGPRVDPRRLLQLLDALVGPARTSGAVVLVNDRLDVALAGGAAGVHLGVRSLPAERARALLGETAWIGVSRHSASEARDRETDGADYVFLGSINSTATHPGAAGLGLAAIEDAVGIAREPLVIGIGGIGPAEVRGVVSAGAYGVAAIRGIWHAEDPGEAVRHYLEVLSVKGE